ncbi:hypothetical protein [Streptomyces sp. NPDC056304]|uniref:hypothetical protein n=1 Tax=Streptomyces sp. NPDC056304 TaxID=3345778 RepID=UPI0035DB9800
MSQISEPSALAETRSDRAGTARAKTIARAVAPETLARASEAADAYLSKLTLAADAASQGVLR